MRPKNSEVDRLLGSNEKIKRLTGWKPSYTFAQGIAETIEWFKEPGNLMRYKADIFNL
jgi:nucleoside-diphosphate-sugar epimerase